MGVQYSVPLSDSIFFKEYDIAIERIKAGENVNVVNTKQESPYYAALHRGHPDLFYMLYR